MYDMMYDVICVPPRCICFSFCLYWSVGLVQHRISAFLFGVRAYSTHKIILSLLVAFQRSSQREKMKVCFVLLFAGAAGMKSACSIDFNGYVISTHRGRPMP